MKLVSWNVNGIRSIHKKGALAPLIETLKPDILCLQETKAEQGQSPIDMPDYEEYWNSAQKKGYSGTAICTKVTPITVHNNLPSHIVKQFDLMPDTYGNPNTEGRVIAAEYKNFFLVTVYTPNSKGDLSRLSMRHSHWDPAFLAYCKELEREKPVIFCGDLNVAHTPDDLANPRGNEGSHGFTTEERGGLDAIITAGFVDTFRLFTKGAGHYTWWSNFSNARARNIGWRIDYFFVSSCLASNIVSARIMSDLYGSDHCPIILELDL